MKEKEYVKNLAAFVKSLEGRKITRAEVTGGIVSEVGRLQSAYCVVLYLELDDEHAFWVRWTPGQVDEFGTKLLDIPIRFQG